MRSPSRARIAAQKRTGEPPADTWRAGCAGTCTSGSEGGDRQTYQRKLASVLSPTQHLPLAGEAAAALFQVITQRYGKGSIALTTNLGVGSWGRIFDDPMVAAAMLDRLLHRSVVFNIDGDSYRMRTHRARAEALRQAVTP